MILNYRAIRLTVLLAIIVAAGSTFGQTAAKTPCLSRIGQKEWTILLKELDAAKRKSLENDTLRKDQVDNMRQLLAFGCEATRLGLNADETNAAELEFIRSETIAGEYDKKKTKVKPGAPFSWITAAQVTAFYKKPANIPAFERFLETKTEIVRRTGSPGSQQPVTAEDEEATKDYYARMKIAESGAAVLLTPAERAAVDLKARIQQSQFLARLAADHIAEEVTVSDEEVAAYIASHPEFDGKEARAKATQLRDRAKAGEDFAKLANEFSEDPGNDGDNGKKNGGLYANVPKGMMVPPFEKASLALEPGQVSDVMQSDFGYHVIKLERKSADGKRYDVRHILIATGFKDPDDPSGRTVPATVYVRSKLENEREAKVIQEIVVKNPVTVEDIQLTAAPAARPATRGVKSTRPATRKR